MGLFGKKNNCKFKDMCNIAGVDGSCRFCATENYQDCDLYQDWSGGGINESNQCPHKDKCPHFPVTCLWGNDPESCFHYDQFEPTSYDYSHSSYNDDDCDEDDSSSTENEYEEKLQHEVEIDESVKAAKVKAEVERIKLQQQIDAAKQKAELAELERDRKEKEERQEREERRKEAKVRHREELENSKDYRVAAALAILLGWIGAHKFYVGKYTSGVVYAIFCWAWIPGILGIITGLKWLTKGQEKFIDDLMDDWEY